jgi:polysaccharide export outer membrane protein
VQAIAQAGGLGVFAAPQRIQIHRKVRGVDSIFLFDYNGYQAGTNATDDINLRAGDVIIVPERGLFE